MALPFFYIPTYNGENIILLSEDTSRHIIQVLRMRQGAQLNLVDGCGHLLTVEITEEHKKHCNVRVLQIEKKERPPHQVSIAISLLKNTDRFEWFLEKATEIGVSSIIPLVCDRTEKEKFRYERMQGICISAMLQSQQYWLPTLSAPISIDTLIASANASLKLIAHCDDTFEKKAIGYFSPLQHNSSLILIGPEGDFSNREIELAVNSGFKQVALGNTRLRTETAGVVAATLLLA
jgi:16S rRNA (uracil1498-N3)-methyltransferase